MIERGGSRQLPKSLCIALAAIAVCIGTTSYSFAQKQFNRANSTPAAAGANSDAFAELPATLAERYPGIRSLVLARRGCVEFEYYKAGVDARTLSPVRSITKSVLSTLVGIALDKGYLRLDQQISAFLPEALDPTTESRVRDITIRDLLTMTSGFDSAGFGTRAGIPPPERWQWALNRPMLHTPGTFFNYDNDSTDMLSVILTRATRQSLRVFADENLFRPLEISSFDWTADNDGYPIGSDRLSLTARDMVKIGLLYLQHGRWDNRQIVSSDYVADSTAKHNAGGAPARGAYGYLWWVTRTRTGLDAFFASGIDSQLIYVVPKLDLVIAMASGSSIRSQSFVNDVVLPAISNASPAPACIARLAQGDALTPPFAWR